MSYIIIIDDDQDIRAILKVMLEDAGHEVNEAADGHDGIALCRQRCPDIVITDILMPGMDGIETIMLLRKEFPSVGTLAISGGGRICADHYLKLAGNLGATRELSKPFTREELITEINTLLNNTASPQAQ